MPNAGPGFVRALPSEETRYGEVSLVAALQRAAASVAERFAGTAPLRIGDLSDVAGGAQPRHGSHRSGRDVDLIFYLTDSEQRSVPGRGWLRIDRAGKAIGDTHRQADAALHFDTPRNWHLLRSLLLDETVGVQWIFCSNAIKARLLRYAIEHEPSAAAIARATWVLHQPSEGNPHADHFHIRIACSRRQLELGCIDEAPLWPWLRSFQQPSSTPLMPSDDASVNGWLAQPAR